MIIILRIFFVLVAAAMLLVTGWAGASLPLWETPRAVVGHPWFVATLCDAYAGFFTFYVWVCYRERRWASRGLWLLAIVLLGNIAMAAYGAAVVFRLPVDARAERVLLRGEPVSLAVPIALISGLGLVTAMALYP